MSMVIKTVIWEWKNIAQDSFSTSRFVSLSSPGKTDVKEEPYSAFDSKDVSYLQL